MNPLRAQALRLLAGRDYTRATLKKKLSAGKDFHDNCDEMDIALLEATLDELVAQGLLSDARYAQSRAAGRASRYGNMRLAQELKQHGVAPELVTEALSHLGDEVARAQAALLRKFGATSLVQLTDSVSRAKQARYLMNRGFSSESVYHALRRLPQDMLENTEE